jgi:flagellar basal-body rod modification protein FlgD
MSSVNSVNTFPPSPETQYDKGGLEETKIDDFLKLMIAELQNQDPLDPMENSEMLQQLGQMRSIGATDKLTATLDAVLVGQNITTASAMIGKEIRALSDDGANIEGVVDRVTVAAADDDEAGGVRIHIGTESISLQNVREILPVAGE